MAPYRILSLDGGGCRAIIESTVLERLMESHPNLLEDVDLFAGASAGSILSLCYAAGFSNSETADFYKNDVKDVFKKSLIREFEVCIVVLSAERLINSFFKDLHGSIGAKYGTEILKQKLEKKFGDMRMRDLKKKGKY